MRSFAILTSSGQLASLKVVRKKRHTLPRSGAPPCKFQIDADSVQLRDTSGSARTCEACFN